jgi:hypothetical protein
VLSLSGPVPEEAEQGPDPLPARAHDPVELVERTGDLGISGNHTVALIPKKSMELLVHVPDEVPARCRELYLAAQRSRSSHGSISSRVATLSQRARIRPSGPIKNTHGSVRLSFRSNHSAAARLMV